MASNKYYSYKEYVSIYDKEGQENLQRLIREREELPSDDEYINKYTELSSQIAELREDLISRYTRTFADAPDQILNVIRKKINTITLDDFKESLKERISILKQIRDANPQASFSSKLYKLTEENFENFYYFLCDELDEEISASAALDLSIEAERIIVDYAGKYYSKEGSIVVPHGKMLDALAKMSTIKPTVDRVGTATFADESLTVVIEQFNQIQRSLGINAHKLLTVGISEFAKRNTYKTNQELDLGVHFSLTDHAVDRGYDISDSKQMKDFRKTVQKDLKILKGQTLYWEERINGKLINFDALSLFGRVYLKGDCIYMELTKSFADYLSQLPLTQYCRNLMLVDGRNPNAYNIGNKLWEHFNLDNNIQKGNNNKLRVKSILKVANLPSYEKILSQRGSWESKIKDPFEKALDDLVKYEVLKSWKYAKKNEEDLTDEDLINLTAYHDWENLIILFEVKSPKDHKKRIARKKNRSKSGKKKTSSSQGENGVATK